MDEDDVEELLAVPHLGKAHQESEEPPRIHVDIQAWKSELKSVEQHLGRRLAGIERKLDLALRERLQIRPTQAMCADPSDARISGMDVGTEASHPLGTFLRSKTTFQPRKNRTPILENAVAFTQGGQGNEEDEAPAKKFTHQATLAPGDPEDWNSQSKHKRSAWAANKNLSVWSSFERENSENQHGRRGSRLTRIAWDILGHGEDRFGNVRDFLKRYGIVQSADVDVPENYELTRGWQFIHGAFFQSISSALIVLNAVLVGYSASLSVQAALQNESEPGWLGVVEILFEVAFVCEILIRIGIEGIRLFFLGPEWKWNFFDLALVVVSLLDSLLETLLSGWSTDITVGRLLRLLRFMRLTRIMRVVRHFSSLRLVLFSILESMSSLLWCFVIIFLIMYIFSIFLMGVIMEHHQDGGYSNENSEVTSVLEENFGGLGRSMVTLFLMITGGLDWGAVLNPLTDVSLIYSVVACTYIFVMQFGVLNVIVGAFCATAAHIASKDRDAVVRREMDQVMTLTTRIKTFFKEADVDNSNTLSWEEFKRHLGRKEVKAYFHSMDLDVSQAHTLFKLLDTDQSNEVTVEEFLDGCMRLKGPARNIDMNILIAAQRKMIRQIRHVVNEVQELGDLSRSIANDHYAFNSGGGGPDSPINSRGPHRISGGSGGGNAANGSSSTHKDSPSNTGSGTGSGSHNTKTAHIQPCADTYDDYPFQSGVAACTSSATAATSSTSTSGPTITPPQPTSTTPIAGTLPSTNAATPRNARASAVRSSMAAPTGTGSTGTSGST